VYLNKGKIFERFPVKSIPTFSKQRKKLNIENEERKMSFAVKYTSIFRWL